MSKFIGRIFGLVAAALVGAVSSPAQAEIPLDVHTLQLQAMVEAQLQGLNWKVGDRTSYKLSGGIINGKVEGQVREETATGFWVQQDMDMGFLGKQKVEILYNKNTGAVEKLLVNGKEEKIPSQDSIEVIEMKEARVRVPAGEYDAIYVKIKDKENNQEQEAWLNPKEIPVSGMLKSIANSPLGKITQELTSFKKN